MFVGSGPASGQAPCRIDQRSGNRTRDLGLAASSGEDTSRQDCGIDATVTRIVESVDNVSIYCVGI